MAKLTVMERRVFCDKRKAELREESLCYLWTCWEHALVLDIVDDDTKRPMIKTLIGLYWDRVKSGATATTKGRRELLRLFRTINDFICHRMLTTPRLSMTMFTPHLTDERQRTWPVPNHIAGLPPL